MERAGAQHPGVEQARERKQKAQEALRISELEISLCKWQRRLHEMERRLQSCEETEVRASLSIAEACRASTAHAADWPRLADALGSLRRAVALEAASGEPAGRSLSPRHHAPPRTHEDWPKPDAHTRLPPAPRPH